MNTTVLFLFFSGLLIGRLGWLRGEVLLCGHTDAHIWGGGSRYLREEHFSNDADMQICNRGLFLVFCALLIGGLFEREVVRLYQGGNKIFITIHSDRTSAHRVDQAVMFCGGLEDIVLRD